MKSSLLFSAKKLPKVLLCASVIGFAIVTTQLFTNPIHAAATSADPSLVIHYNFATNPGDLVKDLSGHGNDGKIVGAKWLPEVQGKKGVLRLDGSASYVDCGSNKSLNFNGDLTFEMWIRRNDPINHRGSFIFGEHTYQQLIFMLAQNDSLLLRYNDEEGNSAVLPVTRSILSSEWSHIAVTVEYPRARFYCNGKLVQDAYMPFPGINEVRNRPKQIGGRGDNGLPCDISEFKLYRRALSAEEITADYKSTSMVSHSTKELAVVPNWYKNTLTMRLTVKGSNVLNKPVKMALLDNNTLALPAKTVHLKDVSRNDSGRYVASAVFPLSTLKDKSLISVATIVGTNDKSTQQIKLTKPEWIQSNIGTSSKVLPPWTSVEAAQKKADLVQVGIWGRQYDFGASTLLNQIETKKTNILNAPISLSGQMNGQKINWQQTHVDLKHSSDTVAAIEQSGRDGNLSFQINSTTEFDGYTIFDCTVTANKSLNLEQLKIDIPLKSNAATLCYSDRGLPIKNKIRMSETYAGKVEGDLSFLFSQVWIGNRDFGLYWQSESDQYWHNADKQKAIQVLPRGGTTYFRANFVDTPVAMQAGQELHYKFALEATPVKPMQRDAWDLRIMRTLYGADLHFPERTVAGKPVLEYIKDAGVRRLFINVNEIWPWPMPKNNDFTGALHKAIDAIHDAGLKEHPYEIHIRFPVTVPEFDIYGAQITAMPMRPYVQAGVPLHEVPSKRPGPLTLEYGADSQGAVIYCPKSQAAQDAYIHSLQKRLEIFGDDGVYLDGTGQIMPCENLLHDCGYIGEDGKIHPTYPVFAAREWIRRIYTVVKQHDPNGLVDLHYWYLNPAQAVYADLTWSGEQWSQLRKTGAPDGYVSAQMPLDMFDTIFTGRQTGTPMEMLSYRLGSTMKVCATSLLYDVPVRLNEGGRSMDILLAGTDKTEGRYYSVLTKLWKIRDKFGAEDAQKYFYWENQDYVQVTPQKCYSTLLQNHKNGVLAFVTNLTRETQTVTVKFNLQKLGLDGKNITVMNALSNKPVKMTPDGTVTVPLKSEEWTYLWLQP